MGLTAVIVWLVWPKNGQNGKNNGWETKKTRENYVDNYLPVELKTPKELEWKVDKWEQAETAKTWFFENSLDVGMVERFVGEMKMKTANNNKEGVITVYSNEAGESIYINTEKREMEYVMEIKNKGQLASGEIIEVARIKDELKQLIGKINGKDNDLIWGNTGYRKMVFPRWVESSEREAQAIEIEADYSIEGKRMTTFFGKTIRATVRRDGKILQLFLVKLPTEIKVEKENQGAEGKEIEARKLDNFGITKIEGGENFEVNWEIIEVGKITVNKAEPVLVFDAKGGRIRSYYQLSGSAWSGKPLQVEMLTSAIK